MITVLAAIFVFGLLIFCHELGHFVLAKLSGVKVHEFSLGFGPRLAGVTRGETVYSLRLLPLGGFNRMAGMDPGEEEPVEEGRGYNHKPVWSRFLVITAGPVANFALAVVILAVIFLVHGYPTITNVVGKVLPGMPAQHAGIRANDRIVAVDGHTVTDFNQLTRIVYARPNREISLVLERGGQKINLSLKATVNAAGQGVIGIESAPAKMVPQGLFEAVKNGFVYTWQGTTLIISYVGRIIFHHAPPEVAGPVRVAVEIGRAAQYGFWRLLEITAFLSINLGIFNLLPVPALDGSRLLFLVVEAMRGRPVDPMKENFIHLVGFGLLMLLMVAITYNDVLHLF